MAACVLACLIMMQDAIIKMCIIGSVQLEYIQDFVSYTKTFVIAYTSTKPYTFLVRCLLVLLLLLKDEESDEADVWKMNMEELFRLQGVWGYVSEEDESDDLSEDRIWKENDSDTKGDISIVSSQSNSSDNTEYECNSEEPVDLENRHNDAGDDSLDVKEAILSASLEIFLNNADSKDGSHDSEDISGFEVPIICVSNDLNDDQQP